jgi:ribosome maturation protein SDO1
MSGGYTIARFQKGSKRFEILVDPDKALDYKLGRRKDFTDILVDDEVYTDAKKGLRAPKSDLKSVFGTTDINEVAMRILREGDLLIKTEQRKKLIEDNKKQIISYISKYCVDSRTGAPLPPIRVENALEEAGVRIDPFTPAEEQVKYVISELTKVIPIKQTLAMLQIKVPAVYVGKAYGFIKNSSDILNENWLSDGSYSAQVAIPAGLKQEFMEKLGSITAGTAYVEVVGEKTI